MGENPWARMTGYGVVPDEVYPREAPVVLGLLAMVPLVGPEILGFPHSLGCD